MSSFTAQTYGDFRQGENPVETFRQPVKARSRVFARLLAALHWTSKDTADASYPTIDAGPARALSPNRHGLLFVLARLVVAIRDYRRAMLELDALTDRDLREMGIDRRDIARICWREARRSSGLS